MEREMDDDTEAMEMETDSPEFTFAEIIQLEKLLKEMKDKPVDDNLCREISAKFNNSTFRCEKPHIKWEQVQSWFRDKQIILTTDVSSPPKGAVVPKAAVIKKREKVVTISASEAVVELQNLRFEARSAKDYAWFDVGSFLSYKFLYSGELVVRVRFAGFGKEEDEWVSVKNAVRERSIPLESSECDKVNVNDLVLCFMEGQDHALYCDARIVDIERKAHDNNVCSCIFTVHYEHDSIQGKVTLDKLCCRPENSASRGAEDDSKLVPMEMQQDTMQLISDHI